MDNAQKYFQEAKKIIDKNKRYIIKSEKVYDLKEGKTDTYLSTIIPYTRTYLNEVFKARRNIDKTTAIKILEPICKESVKMKDMYEKNGMDYVINYFFKEL